MKALSFKNWWWAKEINQRAFRNDVWQRENIIFKNHSLFFKVVTKGSISLKSELNNIGFIINEAFFDCFLMRYGFDIHNLAFFKLHCQSALLCVKCNSKNLEWLPVQFESIYLIAISISSKNDIFLTCTIIFGMLQKIWRFFMHFECASEALNLMYHNLSAALLRTKKIWCQIGVMRSYKIFKFKPQFCLDQIKKNSCQRSFLFKVYLIDEKKTLVGFDNIWL